MIKKKYFPIVIAIFCLLPVSLYANHSFPSDSIPGTMETINKKKSFRFGMHLAGSINYINYGRLELLDIPSNFDWGGNFGFSFDWRLSRINHIRFETFYEYQRLSEHLDNEYNTATVLFKNHGAGINFFPVVLKVGRKFQPQVALGGEFKYIILSEREALLNGRNLALDKLEPNPIQYGVILGLGAYINRTLIEFRLQRSLVKFIEPSNTHHALTQMKFVINL